VREALRAGSLFLAQSRDHVSFWSLVHDDRSWQVSRAQAYQDLGLPTDPQEFLAKITASLDQAARAAADGLARNRFAAVHNGRLKLKRTDAPPISPELRQLREAFQILDACVTGLSVWGGIIALGDALGRVHVFEAEDFLSAEGSASD
jgi:hypothetical protein